MIRNETEYQEAVGRMVAEAARLKEERAKLQGMDFSKEEIKRAMDPLRSFHEQLKEEVESYEKLKRGEFEELRNFDGVGRLLIALRIAKGVSQRVLAGRLGIHESQVSRDERNEYHGVTVDRANRVLEGLASRFAASWSPLRKFPLESEFSYRSPARLADRYAQLPLKPLAKPPPAGRRPRSPLCPRPLPFAHHRAGRLRAVVRRARTRIIAGGWNSV